ncbi:hypothetical protein Tco_0145885 [Tanacetum coccineum]
MSNFLELSSDRYVLYDRVRYPLAQQHERKTRKDYDTKKGRHSTSASSSSAFDHPSSPHYIDDDNDVADEDTSRISTLSPTSYVNSLSDDVPQDDHLERKPVGNLVEFWATKFALDD